MSSNYAAEGIILRSRPLGDRDRMLTVFTKNHGKITVLAKGVRSLKSRRSPYLDLLHHNVFFLTNHRLPLVRDLKPVNGYSGLRQSLPHISQLILVGDLVDQFLPAGEEHPRLFYSLVELLQNLEKTSYRDFYSHYVLWFELQMLSELGFLPELNQCVVCRKEVTPESLGFSPSLGGVVCATCASSSLETMFRLSPTALKVMRFLLQEPMDRVTLLSLSPHVRQDIYRLIASNVEQVLEREVPIFWWHLSNES